MKLITILLTVLINSSAFAIVERGTLEPTVAFNEAFGLAVGAAREETGIFGPVTGVTVKRGQNVFREFAEYSVHLTVQGLEGSATCDVNIRVSQELIRKALNVLDQNRRGQIEGRVLTTRCF